MTFSYRSKELETPLPAKSNIGQHQLEGQVGNCRVGQSPLYIAHHEPPPQEEKNGSKMGREIDNFLYQ